MKFDKKFSESSKRWLQRQAKDPYVTAARKEGYRSRAAYKLIELQEKYHFLKKGQRIVDLGAAPGGWSQVAADLVGSTPEHPKVFALDRLPFPPLPGVTQMQVDFMTDEGVEAFRSLVSGNVDGVLSDLAPSSCGHPTTDHVRIIALVEQAFEFAKDFLKPGGFFVAKVLQGGTDNVLLASLKTHFTKVHHVKPPSSRKESREVYMVALGFCPPKPSL